MSVKDEKKEGDKKDGLTLRPYEFHKTPEYKEALRDWQFKKLSERKKRMEDEDDPIEELEEEGEHEQPKEGEVQKGGKEQQKEGWD